MAVRLVPGDDGLVLEIVGVDRLWCLSDGVRLGWGEVVGAAVRPWDEVRAGLGWRVGGAYWPGRIATGWYTVLGHKGERQLLAVYRDRSGLVVVETTRTRPRRLVVAVPAAQAPGLAQTITERVGAAGT